MAAATPPVSEGTSRLVPAPANTGAMRRTPAALRVSAYSLERKYGFTTSISARVTVRPAAAASRARFRAKLVFPTP